jgi:hypothetical protein
VLTWSVNCKRPQLPFSFGDSSVVAKHPRLGTHPDIPVAPLTGRSSYPSFDIIERQLPAKNAPTSCLFSIPSAHFQKSAYLIENKGKLPFCKSFDVSLFRTPFHSFPGSPLVSSFYQLHTGGVGTPPSRSRVSVAGPRISDINRSVAQVPSASRGDDPHNDARGRNIERGVGVLGGRPDAHAEARDLFTATHFDPGISGLFSSDKTRLVQTSRWFPIINKHFLALGHKRLDALK